MTETIDRMVSFIETKEYLRFAEFCDACRQYRYVGLCHGPPGVGKTLSARRYGGAENREVEAAPGHLGGEVPSTADGRSTVFYTVPVVSTPGILEREIGACRQELHELLLEPLRQEEEAAIQAARAREREQTKEWQEMLFRHDWFSGPPPRHVAVEPTIVEMLEMHRKKRKDLADPTDLILIDEADRLRMSGLEAVRAVFDRGGVGLVLIGMPGMEKRLARYPQFYSRIGFVHGFRSLGAPEVRSLIGAGWTPPNVVLPPIQEEAIAAIVRITGGNFRLLDRLLLQAGRIVKLNGLTSVTVEAVNAARESLVIGQA